VNKTTVTKRDVAKLAGVSHMTVTRVLAGATCVSPSTRRRVLWACQELRYRPNIAASSLRTRRSHAIGVVVPNLEHTFFARLVNVTENLCTRAGYHTIMIQRRFRNGRSSFRWPDFEFLLGRQIDGLLIYSNVPNTMRTRLKRERVPMVFVEAEPGDPELPFVCTDSVDGSRRITEHLIEAGHRRIAYLAGPENHPNGRRRVEGFRAAMDRAGLEIPPNWIRHTNYNMDGGREAMRELLAAKLGFTAVACASDYVAIGAMSACHEQGVAVPEDVSITGFTGDPIGEYTTPPLTTMSQPVQRVSRRALEILLEMIAGSTETAPHVLESAELVVRRSVKRISQR